jgi:cation:H+ antiporter
VVEWEKEDEALVNNSGLKATGKIVGFVSDGASALWTFPSVIGSAMLIAWGAEAAQFLVSQGMALAILAWLQTLPEFAVEAVIAWEAGKDPEKTHLMIANLTGSLRLLVGLGWPLIYFTAAMFHRRKYGQPLKAIHLDREHSVEVTGLGVPILYFFFIWFKGTLEWYDSLVLITIYLVYLFVLNKIPPQSEEKIEDMEAIPRWILLQPRVRRNAIIIGLFAGGGVILYFVAHPFLDSMLALAVSLGISNFVFVQWVAPFLSEFPEKVSALYWARKITGAPMALMNMVSSNINQWTMLAAMLPLVFAASRGAVTPIVFDAHQELEILLTISQSLLGMVLLANMQFAWWEALAIFTLWGVQFVFSASDPALANPIKQIVTAIYFVWAGVEFLRVILRQRIFEAFEIFPRLVREHW